MIRLRTVKSLFVLLILLAIPVMAMACGEDEPADDGGTGDSMMDNSMAMEEKDKSEIVFSDLNWSSALIQNRIAQFIVENGYGYPTSAIAGATLPNFQGLLKGDIHVDMEVWLPNQIKAWEEALANNEVVEVGESLGKDWQSNFVIPQYLADQYPDLRTVEDLKNPEYNQLFQTTESRGKARLVGCVIGWSCEVVTQAQMESYGLNDLVDVVPPASQDALFADLDGKYSRQEPWLGYMWGTADPALVLDLVRLEEPPYTEECWATTKACAFEDAAILIAVHPSLVHNAPDVVEFLRNWGFNIDIYKSAAKYAAANPGAEAQDIAIWWLKGNESLWSTWVPTDVAGKVSAALANES